MQEEEDQRDTKTVNTRKRRKMELSTSMWNRPPPKYDDHKSREEGFDNSVNTVHLESEMAVEAEESLENLDQYGTPESQPPHQMVLPISPIECSGKSTNKWNIIPGTPFPSSVNDYSYYGRRKPQRELAMSSLYESNCSVAHSRRDNSRSRMKVSRYDKTYMTKSSSKLQTVKGGFHNGWQRGLNPRHHKVPSPERPLNLRDALASLEKETKNPDLTLLDYIYGALQDDPHSDYYSERTLLLLTTRLLHATNSSCAIKILGIFLQCDHLAEDDSWYKKVMESTVVRAPFLSSIAIQISRLSILTVFLLTLTVQ
jgi:hypothetical protein